MLFVPYGMPIFLFKSQEEKQLYYWISDQRINYTKKAKIMKENI